MKSSFLSVKMIDRFFYYLFRKYKITEPDAKILTRPCV